MDLLNFEVEIKGRYYKTPLVQPFLKWAGGKRQLLPEIRKHIPKEYKRYFEPFIGAGAVLFDLQPKVAFINDMNPELINLYCVIRDSVDELIEEANSHLNNEEYFYEIRKQDRSSEFAKLSPVSRAARIIYLNKTCFNGLFRVNSNGQFNAPFGNYLNPKIADPVILRAVSNYLNAREVTVSCGDFYSALLGTKKGDFVYFDPPYDPVSDTSSFTGYQLDGFGKNEQKRLRDLCNELTAKSVQLLLSNSDTDYIRELYSDKSKYKIFEVLAKRNINAVGTGRGKVSELLICNYDKN